MEAPGCGIVGADGKARLWKPEKTVMDLNSVTCPIFNFKSSKIHIFIE